MSFAHLRRCYSHSTLLLAAVSAAIVTESRGGARSEDASSSSSATSAQISQHERACSMIIKQMAGEPRHQRGGGAGRNGGSQNSTAGLDRWLRITMAGKECTDNLQRSALALAAMHGDGDAVLTLLEAGYDPNSQDVNHLTPLEYAAWKGHVDIVRILLAAGADPFQFDDFGVTPVHKAAAFGHPLILQQLLNTGRVPVDARTGPIRAPLHYEAKTLHQMPLHLALRPSANITPAQRLKMVEILLAARASPDVPDVFGDTALHYAARLGDIQALWYLVSAGADRHVKNAKGERPIDVLPWSYVYLAPFLVAIP